MPQIEPLASLVIAAVIYLEMIVLQLEMHPMGHRSMVSSENSRKIAKNELTELVEITTV